MNIPQMNKCGKFIFGKFLIREDLTLHLPPQAVAGYNIAIKAKFIFSSKAKAPLLEQPTPFDAQTKVY